MRKIYFKIISVLLTLGGLIALAFFRLKLRGVVKVFGPQLLLEVHDLREERVCTLQSQIDQFFDIYSLTSQSELTLNELDKAHEMTRNLIQESENKRQKSAVLRTVLAQISYARKKKSAEDETRQKLGESPEAKLLRKIFGVIPVPGRKTVKRTLESKEIIAEIIQKPDYPASVRNKIENIFVKMGNPIEWTES